MSCYNTIANVFVTVVDATRPGVNMPLKAQGPGQEFDNSLKDQD